MSQISSTSSGSRAAGDTGSVLGLQMPSIIGDNGSVLGATTPVVAGAAILPITGNNPWVLALVITSMTIASLVLISFVATRIIRKFMVK